MPGKIVIPEEPAASSRKQPRSPKLVHGHKLTVPSLFKRVAMLIYWPIVLSCVVFVGFLFSPLVIPTAIAAAVIAVIIGGNPFVWICEFLADLGPRVIDFLATLGPRFLNFTPPAPSFAHDGEFPTIENVDAETRWAFAAIRGPTYIRKMIMAFFKATYLALFNYKLRPVEDEEMGRIFLKTTYCQFFHRIDKIPQWAAESGIQAAKSERVSYYVIDCSYLNHVKPYPEMYLSSTISLWRATDKPESERPPQDLNTPRRPSDFMDIVPIAILVMTPSGNRYVCRPGDAAWDAAKLFVTHGVNHLGVLRDHPKIHFPFDSINVYTQRLPKSHIIRQILAPHQRLTLALNDIVLNSYFLSIVINPYMTQSPFDADPMELRKYLQQCRDTFAFETAPFPASMPENSPYVLQMTRYHAAFRQFVAKVVATVSATAAQEGKPSPFRDALAQQWADDISAIIPGFPNGKELAAGGDQLAIELLAKIMWNLSCFHSIDHYSFTVHIPWNINPWRIRQPVPESKDESFDFDAAHARVDMWKLCQAHEVFFWTGSSTTMAKVDYKFKDNKLRAYQKEFITQMHQINKIQDPAHLMDLKLIGQSIDF